MQTYKFNKPYRGMKKGDVITLAPDGKIHRDKEYLGVKGDRASFEMKELLETKVIEVA